jgi:threonine synthase
MDRSGVWRFRELLPFLEAGTEPVSLGEGSTALVEAPRAATYAGLQHLEVKHQGTNPTGSFKDLGMTACISHALSQGAKVVACASTGNTSSSMAAYAARAGIRALLFVPAGGVSSAKLAQSLEFGALPVETGENFDEALQLLRSVAGELGWYVVNSINPYRLEGQKTVVAELLEQRRWRPPEYLALPGGNLGNVSALGKGLRELSELGLLSRVPRLVVVQASGADPFFQMWRSGARSLRPLERPQTRATAIRIGNPANWAKALRALEWSEGLCEAVTDLEIAAAKDALAADGIGAEPASATTVAGVRKLRESGQIEDGAEVVALLTGHQLKDVDYILERRGEGGSTPGLRLEPDPETAPGILSDWLASLA